MSVNFQTNRYPHMVHEYYVAKLREIERKRQETLASLKSKSDARRYVQNIRRAVKQAFVPVPPKTPLNARTTGMEETKDHVFEKVVFESRPGFLVTGNLYVPKGEGGKRPAVLVFCGHDGAGKAYGHYQSLCLGLVKRGFVVFTTDPIEQGERRQFYPKHGGPRPHLCQAHNIIGNQQVLLGDFFGMWRGWDCVRALDYLVTRPEVDPNWIAATGNSGGGTDTTLLAAVDSRVKVLAPSCYICSWPTNLINELPADAEQNPPGILAFGVDQADLLMSFAPRPTLICSQFDDFFETRIAERGAKEIAKVNRLLGLPRSAEFFAGPHGHGLSIENREAIYAFLMKHGGIRGSAKEGKLKLREIEDTHAVTKGEVYRMGSRSAFEYTGEHAKKFKRRKLSEKNLQKKAMELLGVKLESQVPAYRPLRYSMGFPKKLGAPVQFAVESEPGIQVLITALGEGHQLMHPGRGKARVYIGNTSSIDDILRLARINRLIKGPRAFFTLDPRGIGESEARSCGSFDFLDPYGSDYIYASAGELLGQSYLGRRVHDTLRGLDFLISKGTTDIEIVGRGLGSVVAAFAALLHQSQPKLQLLDYLPSYELLATTPLSDWPLSVLLRDVLNHFDLPDVYRALGRRLKRGKPWPAKIKRERTR